MQADFVQTSVSYELDGSEFRGHLIYSTEASRSGVPLPGLFMIPNWMGPDKASTLAKARSVAGDEFVVFVA